MARRWGNQYAIGEDISRFLPTDAYHKGFRLTWESPISWGGFYDPVILIRLGAPGEELYRWNYIPSLTEVFEVCKKLMEEQR